ncbi:hypothetical protein ACTFR8_28510 [Bacillus cereus group sp. MYBK15-3]|uniref:hypothetical protein n=1 Tax=unclassified Bacillus cereus group TaxID=2750818 RepID=UPI003F7AF31F
METLNKRCRIAVLILLLFVIIGLCFFAAFLFKIEKHKNIRIETEIEQTRKNVNIAEELIEKEINKDRKYFKLSNGDEQLLSSDTNISWVDKNLVCHVLLEGESYEVYFKTNKIINKEDYIKIYEPVVIDKFIKIK